MSVLSASMPYPQKSIYTVRGDFSVLGERVDEYSWQVLRPQVSDGKCILQFVYEEINPRVNTQLSWLKCLAGASNVQECSDAQALQAAGDPAIFWGLIALSIERDEQPSRIIEAVNQGAWVRPLEGKRTGRIVIVDIYCDPGIPNSRDHEFEFPRSQADEQYSTGA
ncbi:hypothetical protein HOY80DRAFT_896744 [Tuber brumale]|nr:hypothetical protein HOY80DRAFT_896744 [Tuber brumale]